MQCTICLYIGSEGEAHYNIVAETGNLMAVNFMSADSYRDCELKRSEYFVEYKGDEECKMAASPALLYESASYSVLLNALNRTDWAH